MTGHSQHRRNGRSIVFKLAVIVTTAIIFSAGLAVAISRYKDASRYKLETRAKMEITANALAVALRSKLAMNDTAVGDIVKENIAVNDDLVFCSVLDKDGNPLFESDKAPGNLPASISQVRVPVEIDGQQYGTVVIGYEEGNVFLDERRRRVLLAARTISSSIAADLETGDYARAEDIVREFVSTDPDFSYTVLYGRNDIPVFRCSGGMGNCGEPGETDIPGGLNPGMPVVAKESPGITRVLHAGEKGDFIDAMVPVKSSGLPVGKLRLGYSLASLENEKRKSDFQLFMTILFFVGIGLVSAYLIARNFAEPVVRIATAARDVARGDMDRKVEVHSVGREVQDLADSFNDMVGHRREAVSKLEESRNQLRNLARRVLSVQEEERARIARELHDEFGHRVMGLSLKLSYFKKKGMLPEEELESFSSLLKETSDEVIRIYRGLSPAFIERMGISEAVDSLVTSVEEKTGPVIETDLDDIGQDEISSDTAMNLYRIAQEALNNIVKYAEPDRVWVSLKKCAGNIVLEIADDGRGMDFSWENEFGGIGLLGMRERTLAMNGTLNVESALSEGTRIVVTIPTPEGHGSET